MHKYFITFDLETTGLAKERDQIIQIAATKYDYATFEVVDSINEYIKPIGNYSISIAAFFKHGIKPIFLEDKPHLKDIAPRIVEFFGDDDVDIVTFNGNRFDIPFLKIELNKYGCDIDFTKRRCFDCYREENRRHRNNLGDTFTRYNDGVTMEEAGLQAHDAFSDITATTHIFKCQLQQGGISPEKMYGEDGVFEDRDFRGEIRPCFTLGKYNQLSIDFVASIDQPYLEWCISDKSNFQKSTKEFIKQFLNN